MRMYMTLTVIMHVCIHVLKCLIHRFTCDYRYTVGRLIAFKINYTESKRTSYDNDTAQ